jgi:hypothetical protein
MLYFTLILAFLISSCFTFAQDDQMKIWMKYSTPGKPHEEFSKFIGDWKVSSKMWQQPDTEPIFSTGKANMKLLLGGRYLKTAYNATFMGMPFEGIAVDAYDNAKKQYLSIWMDNFGTGISIMYGKSDDDGKTIFYEGSMFDPLQNKDVKIKSIVYYISENEILMEMYGYHNDVEFKSMEMKYYR